MPGRIWLALIFIGRSGSRLRARKLPACLCRGKRRRIAVRFVLVRVLAFPWHGRGPGNASRCGLGLPRSAQFRPAPCRALPGCPARRSAGTAPTGRRAARRPMHTTPRETGAEMACSGRPVRVVQVVGLHPVADQRAKQRLERCGTSSFTPFSRTDWESTGMPASMMRRIAVIGGSARAPARWLQWMTTEDRLFRIASASIKSRSSMRSGIDHRAPGCGVRTTPRCPIVIEFAHEPRSLSRRGDSRRGSPPVRITSQTSGRLART